MCETSKIAFVAICVRSSYKMPGLITREGETMIYHRKRYIMSIENWIIGYSKLLLHKEQQL